MSSSHELITDDQVAELLLKEAGECALKYSAMGMDAFKPDKRPANQPKPNTRFLNNIIRDTNSHNRALLAKENADSQARLRELEVAERQKREEERRRERRTKPDASDTRKRMLGDIAAILGGPSKRRKANDDGRDRDNEDNNNRPRKSRASMRDTGDRRSKSRSRSRSRDARERKEEEDDRKAKRRSRKDEDHSDDRDSHRRSHRHEEKDREQHRDRDRDRHRHQDRHRDRHRDRDRDRRSSSIEEREREREREERHRTRKEQRSRDKEDGRSRRQRDSEKAETNKRKDAERLSKDDSSDSDPLEDIIGPAPPSKSTVRRRGRGVNSAMSGIDNRFAADYDPRVDVTPDPEEATGDGNDWDNAVETFRDRMKWKQQGAERLRSAGFTEEQIRKWEKGDEKDETDVKWNEAGGVREWDRGKVVTPDGAVMPKPEYGRLKGT